MARLTALFVVLMFALASCTGSATTPCNDADPTGICASSHSHTYDNGR